MPRLSPRARDRALVLLGMLAFVAATTWLNWLKLVTLRSTYSYDLGFFHNVAANFSLDRDRTYLLIATWFSPGDHDGPSIFRSSHFTPLRLLVLPLGYALWPDVRLLMAAQSAFLASGALALWGFAGRRTGSRWPGLLLAGSYLLHPLLLHMGFNDLREIQLGIGPALFALAAHAERRWLAFGGATLLMLGARPEFAFLLALFPVLNWRLTSAPDRGRAWWLAPPLAAAGWVLLTAGYSWYFFGVALPHLVRTGEVAAGGPLASLPGRLLPLLGLTLLPGLLALLTPEALVVALPFLAAARDVSWPHLPQHHLQHLSPLLAVLMWAFTSALVRGAAALSSRPALRRVVQIALAVAALASFAQFARAVKHTYLDSGLVRYGRLDALEAALPREATVLVPERLVARFSGHARVLNYEALLPEHEAPGRRAAFFGQALAVADLVATEREGWLDELVARAGRFDPPVSAAGAHVFVAQRRGPPPADPDAVLERLLAWPQMSPRRRLWLRRPPLAAPAP